MIEEAYGGDQPCAVCCLDPADCVCPECPTCTAQGDPSCYKEFKEGGHGLKLTKAQAVSRQSMVLFMVTERLREETQVLVVYQTSEQTEWELDDVADPWK
jgi:hypothetical protein